MFVSILVADELRIYGLNLQFNLLQGKHYIYSYSIFLLVSVADPGAGSDLVSQIRHLE
jgi:hypothetical protein